MFLNLDLKTLYQVGVHKFYADASVKRQVSALIADVGTLNANHRCSEVVSHFLHRYTAQSSHERMAESAILRLPARVRAGMGGAGSGNAGAYPRQNDERVVFVSPTGYDTSSFLLASEVTVCRRLSCVKPACPHG